MAMNASSSDQEMFFLKILQKRLELITLAHLSTKMQSMNNMLTFRFWSDEVQIQKVVENIDNGLVA